MSAVAEAAARVDAAVEEHPVALARVHALARVIADALVEDDLGRIASETLDRYRERRADLVEKRAGYEAPADTLERLAAGRG